MPSVLDAEVHVDVPACAGIWHVQGGQAPGDNRLLLFPPRHCVAVLHTLYSLVIWHPQTPPGMHVQGNLRTDLVSGSGWDQLVLPMGTCVSYVKDLAPLAFNDQARRAPAAACAARRGWGPCMCCERASHISGIGAGNGRFIGHWHVPSGCQP